MEISQLNRMLTSFMDSLRGPWGFAPSIAGTIQLDENGVITLQVILIEEFLEGDTDYTGWKGYKTIHFAHAEDYSDLQLAMNAELLKIPKRQEREIRYAIYNLAKLEGQEEKMESLEVKAIMADVISALTEFRLLLEGPDDTEGLQNKLEEIS